jgi:hypothetical protein
MENSSGIENIIVYLNVEPGLILAGSGSGISEYLRILIRRSSSWAYYCIDEPTVCIKRIET